MAADNATIAAVFAEIGNRLAIQGENEFRIRAYGNAARVLQGYGPSLEEMVRRDDDLTEIPGIGADLAKKIREIVETGKCAYLEKLRSEMPASITELLKVPGLGPKRVALLWHELDLQTPEQVLHAARAGRIRSLPRFGEKMERQIEAAVASQLTPPPRSRARR
jgi:DNA polymerase (family X)